MDPEFNDYPANGTLEDLSRTCMGDEKGFRARLVGLERGEDPEGKKGIHATYDAVPFNKPFPKKKLFFFDITDATATEIKDITEDQLAQRHALAYGEADHAEVYLEDKEAVVMIFREP